MKVNLLAVVLFCCWAQVARGQCTGYSITSTQVNLLSANDAAKQGQMAATIAIVVDGGVKNGKVVVTPGTVITYPYITHTPGSDTSYGTSWYTIDNDPTKYPWGANSLSGTVGPATTSQAEVGHTYHMFYKGVDVTTGSFSIDEVDRQVVAGPNDTIIKADGVPDNAYYQLVSIFGGGSMMNNCGECQGGETQQCLQATHTPLFDATLTNPRTGEVQTISNASAGNVATAQQSVSGTASVMISTRPGDSPTGSTTDKIYCSMFGWVMAQEWNPGIPETEFAITAEEVIPSTCTLVLRFFGEMGDGWGVQCNVAWKKPPATADRCSTASQIPDFNPGAVWDEVDCKVAGDCGTSDLPPPNGPNTSFPKYYFTAARGIRFGGPPSPGIPDPIINGGAHDWLFPWYVAQGYIPAGPSATWWTLFLNLAIPKGTGLPIDCTNKDKGTSPIQTPF